MDKIYCLVYENGYTHREQICDSLETAQKLFYQEREKIKFNFIDNINEFDLLRDEETHFSMGNVYEEDEIISLFIVEHPIITNNDIAVKYVNKYGQDWMIIDPNKYDLSNTKEWCVIGVFDNYVMYGNVDNTIIIVETDGTTLERWLWTNTGYNNR
jgi:hypothetical protein